MTVLAALVETALPWERGASGAPPEAGADH